jgi:hypothetical protein
VSHVVNNNMLREEGEEYISWDFDDTLYDTKTQGLNM